MKVSKDSMQGIMADTLDSVSDTKPVVPLPFYANSKEYREALESITQADGPNAEAAASILQELNELLPPKSAIERRIEGLEHILKSPLIGEHIANATTVLDGYQSGRLKYVAGHYYVFRDGQMLAGPRRLLNFDEKKVVFDEFDGPKGLWIEFCEDPPCLLGPNTATFRHNATKRDTC